MKQRPHSQSITQNVQFVHDTLIAKGYKMEEFQAYLATKKENGYDLAYWSVDELMNLAAEFQFMNQQHQNQYQQYHDVPPDAEEEKQKLDNPHSNLMENKLQQQDSNLPIQPAEGSIEKIVQYHMSTSQQLVPNFIELNRYHKVSPCKLLEINPLSPFTYEHSHATIESFMKVDGKFYKKSYIEYVVKLMPQGVEAKQRYSHFEMLTEYLTSQYPEFIIPPLPKKSTKDPNVRMPMLERYLNRLLDQPEFRVDPILESFMMNPPQFQQLVQRAHNRSMDIDQIATQSGTVTLQLSDAIDSHFKIAQEYMKPQLELVKQIRRQAKKVMGINTLLCAEVKQLGNLYSQLFSLNQAQNQKSNVGQSLKQEGVNIVLNNTFLRWSQQIENQNKILKDHILNFYKFTIRGFDGLSELLEKQLRNKQELNSKLKKVHAEKERLFEQKNIEKWDVLPSAVENIGYQNLLNNKELAMMFMLPNKTEELWKARDNLAYINNKIFEQYQYMREADAKETAANFIEFSSKQRELFTSVLNVKQWKNFWGDVIAAMKTFGFEAKLLKTELIVANRISKQRSLELL